MFTYNFINIQCDFSNHKNIYRFLVNNAIDNINNIIKMIKLNIICINN